jgi:neurexin
VSLNLIDLALNDSQQITKHGSIEKTCRRTMDPVTFSSPNSYIPIHDWKDYPKLRSFSIEFQTTENHGVLAYILGSSSSNNNPNQATTSLLKSLNRDFFSLEIHNRFLNAYFNLGSGYIRHEVVHEHVSSGKPHQITVEINDNTAVFKFDQKPETTIRIDAHHSAGADRLELQGPLIIGGIYPNHTAAPMANPSLIIPPYFYSGMLGHGYVGCIQDVEINGQFVNLTHHAARASVGGISTDMCTPMPNQCDIGHCLNEGVCMEGWNRFVCDCSATGFNGPICSQRKFILQKFIWFLMKCIINDFSQSQKQNGLSFFCLDFSIRSLVFSIY